MRNPGSRSVTGALALMLVLSVLGVFTGQIPAAELNRLDGATSIGSVSALSASSVTWMTTEGEQAIPLDQVMSLRWPENAKQPNGQDRQTVLTVDGSVYSGQIETCDGRQVRLDSPAFGAVSIPLQQVRAVLFGDPQPGIQEQWQALLNKGAAEDLLVILKGDKLDFLPGVITEYNQNEVQFLYNGSEIPVKRTKVFGMIHPRNTGAREQVLAELTTTLGDLVAVRSVSLNESELTLQTAAGVTCQLPVDRAAELDFSLGKVVRLSELEPEGVEHTPYFDTIWTYQRDRTNIGRPLRLGGVTYPHGLWIHSRTRLTYRLAGDFKQLRTMIGIDDGVAANGLGNVDVQILGDDKVLFEGTVTARNEPQMLDLDVSNVRFLKIFVDFGKGLDIGDHLVLGDPRLIK